MPLHCDKPSTNVKPLQELQKFSRCHFPFLGSGQVHEEVDTELCLKRQREVGKVEAIQGEDTHESRSAGWRDKEGMLAEGKQWLSVTG